MAGEAPNPGSDAARAAGCRCAVMDNNRGRFPPFPPGSPQGGATGGWWVTMGCPVHAPAAGADGP